MKRFLFLSSCIGCLYSISLSFAVFLNFKTQSFNAIYWTIPLVLVWFPVVKLQIKWHKKYGQIEPEPKGLLNQMSIYWGGIPKYAAALSLTLFCFGLLFYTVSFFQLPENLAIDAYDYLKKSSIFIGLWAIAFGMHFPKVKPTKEGEKIT